MARHFAVLLVCLVGLVFGQNDTMFNETSDVVNIDCETMTYMLPGVNIMMLQDDASNGTNATQLSNETDVYDYNQTETYDYGNQDFTLDNSTYESDDNDTLSGNDTLFNDAVMMKLKEMGFPFQVACQLDGDFVNVTVLSAENSTQIIEIMAQVRINGTASGLFLTPEDSQDYQLSCLGQAVTQVHNDAKEMLSATWYNSEGVDLENGTNAQCVLSILDTDGNFWQMVELTATDGDSTMTMMTEEEEEAEDEKAEEEMKDVEFTATDFEMNEEKPADVEPETTVPEDKPESEDEKLSEGAAESDVEFQPIDEDIGDLGQIVADGETYHHHCINNNMIRVLVPYTGCSDFITVVGGLPRSYQTCGLDKCFDVNNCECVECQSITCEKLAAGSTQTYSIRIYNTEGKEVGVVSGERTRTISGGLTESISATGDPRSSLFPIDMK